MNFPSKNILKDYLYEQYLSARIKLNKLAADRIKAKKPLTVKQILKQAEKLAELDILLGQLLDL